PGRWPSTSPAAGSDPRPCTRRTITSSPTSPPTSPAWATSTSPPASGRTAWSSSARSNRAAPTGRMESRSAGWPASPRRWWCGPRRSWGTSSARSSIAKDARAWPIPATPRSPPPAASSGCSRPRTKAFSTTSARPTPTTSRPSRPWPSWPSSSGGWEGEHAVHCWTGMSTRRWDPLRDLLSLQEKMNRLFEDSLAATRTDPGVPASAWTPAADAYETPEGFVVLMDLPGLSADEVEIHVDGERLIVHGERRPDDKTRPESFHRVERSYGVFTRIFQLTDEVDPDKVTANFRDGLLRLELPRLRPRSGGRGRERPDAGGRAPSWPRPSSCRWPWGSASARGWPATSTPRPGPRSLRPPRPRPPSPPPPSAGPTSAPARARARRPWGTPAPCRYAARRGPRSAATRPA